MIDARKFASDYTAFWGSVTPTCKHFIGKINNRLSRYIEPPMPDSQTEYRSYIAELGFLLFLETRWPTASERPHEDILLLAQEAARTKIKALNRGAVDLGNFTSRQIMESAEISRRLSKFFRNDQDFIMARPLFSGCGIIDHSEADIIFGKTLYEIKTVDRNFRGRDIRQLITYCALNHMGKQYDLAKIGIYNPRRGTIFEADIEMIAYEICGGSPEYLFEEICQAISGGGVSR